MKAEELDKKFDEGKDITSHMDISKSRFFSSGSSTFRMRGLVAIGCLLGIQAGMFFAVCDGFLGGSQGAIKGGEYFLESHGELTEVSGFVWQWMGWIEIVGITGWCLAAICISTAFLLHFRKSPWYEAQTDYSIVLPIIMASDLLIVVAGHLLGRY